MEILKILTYVLSEKRVTEINEFNKLKESDYLVYHFLAFLEKEDNRKIFSEIFLNVKFSFKHFFITKIKPNLNLNEDEYCMLQTVFILKSLKKSNFEMVKEIDKLTTIDDIMNSHLKFEKKFWIFRKKELYPFCSFFKKEIFRVYSLLSLKKIIKEKIIINNLKTHKQWIFDYEDFENSEIEKFKISFSPFNIIEIRDRFFLFSEFFTLTTEIFKENIKSSKRFDFKNKDYLEKLCQRELYFDEKAFSRIYFRKKTEKNVKSEIQLVVDKIKNIDSEISILANLSKEEYIRKFKIKIKKDILELDEMSLFLPFKKFAINWVEKTFKKKIEIVYWKKIWFFILNKLIYENLSLLKEEKFNNYLESNKLNFYNMTDSSIIEEEEEETENLILQNDIDLFIENSLKKLILIYKNLNLSEEIKLDYGIEMSDIRRLEESRIDLRSQLSKLYQLNYLDLIWSIKDKLINKKIYFPLFFDFRGRMYIHSSIGVTNYKLSRYFFNYGLYKKEEIIEQNKWNIAEIHKFKNIIDFLKKKFNIVSSFNCFNECIFWCLIAIGKEFIDKSKTSSSTEEILELGLEKIIKNNLEKDDEKWIIIEHYKEIIQSLNSDKIVKKFILKDATASFIQNAIRIIGPKDKFSLEFANLGTSDRWYDTYALALKIWKDSLIIKNNLIQVDVKKKNPNEIKLINQDILKYFVRKTIKKPIMTDAYEASYFSKWAYFKKSVNEEFQINVESRTDIEFLFKNFNEFLENNFWNEYFLFENSDVMINYINELIKDKKEILISSLDSNSNLCYYKFKDKVIDVTVTIPETNEKIRKTKKFLVLDKEQIDIKKIKTAVKPNWVHFSDAFLTRQINSLLPNPLFSIHDCFLIDCLNVSNFIMKANKSFKSLDSFSIAKNRELLQKVNSIFIFF